MQNLFGEVLAMGDEDETSEKGKLKGFNGIALEIIADEREANESEQAGQNAFANEGEQGDKEQNEGNGEMIIVEEQSAEVSGDAFAAMEAELGGPDVADDDGNHGQGDIMRIAGPMAGGPNGESAFATVAKEGYAKTGPAEGAPDIFCTDAAAALSADIASGADADEVIAGGETTEHVSAQGNPTCLGPIRRLNLLNPRHSCLASTHNQRFSA